MHSVSNHHHAQTKEEIMESEHCDDCGHPTQNPRYAMDRVLCQTCLRRRDLEQSRIQRHQEAKRGQTIIDIADLDKQHKRPRNPTVRTRGQQSRGRN
jgi:hypothetical protein